MCVSALLQCFYMFLIPPLSCTSAQDRRGRIPLRPTISQLVCTALYDGTELSSLFLFFFCDAWFVCSSVLLCLHDGLGMLFEVIGTLAGAVVQGQLVSSAHSQKHCLNKTAGNSSGVELQDFLLHAVNISRPGLTRGQMRMA